MKTRKVVPLVAVVLSLLPPFATPGRAALIPDPRTSLLLRYQLTLDYEGVSTSEYLIYRDGLVIAHTIQPNGQLRLSRALASADLLTALKQALRTNHVGMLEAINCVGFDPFPTGASFNAALTWFRNGRQNRMTFGGGSVLCPVELDQIVIALDDFLGEVTYTDTVTTVP